MKRNIFFWLDRLQISRKERISITTCFTIILISVLLTPFIQPVPNYDPQEYEQILEIYQERTRILEARQLEREQKYEPGEIIEQKKEPASQPKITDPIDINKATLTELTRLPGIGEAYAKRIIDYRQTKGEFTAIEELTKVRGIGQKRLEKLKPFIKI